MRIIFPSSLLRTSKFKGLRVGVFHGSLIWIRSRLFLAYLHGPLLSHTSRSYAGNAECRMKSPKPYLRPRRPSVLGFHLKDYTMV